MNDDFDKDLDWLRGDDDEDNDAASNDDDDALDWMAADDDQPGRDQGEHLGVTGELDWLRDEAGGDDDEEADDRDAAFDWETAEEGTGSQGDSLGVTGELSWLGEDVERRFEDQLDQSTAAADQSDDDELPDWLRDETPEPETAAPPSAESSDEELPPWLTGADFEEEEIEEPQAPAAQDVPDWMQGPLQTEPDDSRFEVREDEEDLPEWLTGSTFTEDDDGEAQPPEVPAAQTGDDELPPWMTDATFEEEADEEQPFEAPAAQTGDDELPDWLTGAAPAETPQPEPAAPDDEFELTDWMEDDTTFEPSDEAGEEEDELAALFAEDMPDDLFGEEDFAAEQEEEDVFELLGDSAQDPALDDLLGGLEEDEDEFDLLGELSGPDEAPDFTEPELEPSAEFDDLDALFAETDTEEEEPVFNRVEPDAEFEDVDALFADDDDEDIGDLDALFAAVAREEEEEARVDWFGEEDEEAAAQPAEDLTWLSGIDAESEAVEEEPAAQAEPTADEYDLDSYLDSLEAGPSTTDQGEGISADELDLDSLFAEESGQTSQPARPGLIAEDAPDWLTDLSETVGTSTAAAIVRQQQDRPVEDLPERLRLLHERGLELPTDVEGGDAPADILPGVKNTLPLSKFDTAAGGSIGALVITPEQRAQAEILQRIAGREVTDETEAQPTTRRRLRLPLERLAITLLLVLAVVLPFLLDELRVGDLPPAAFEAGSVQESFVDQVELIEPGQLVLVAVEYAPTGAAELDTATDALLRHLLLREAVPVIVGGTPTGLLHVSTLADDIAAENDLDPGTDYVVGRYLVGDSIGVRAFSENLNTLTATDVRGEDTGLDLQTLDAFTLIVVVAERADRLRTWAEQVAPLTDTPLIGITGAAAAPLSEPYLDAQNEGVAGLLTGYADGYTYQRYLNVLMGVAEPDVVIPPVETEEAPVTEEPTPEVIIPPDATEEVTEPVEEITVEEVTQIVTEPVEEIIVEEVTQIVTEDVTEAVETEPAQPTVPIITEAVDATETPLPTETPTATETPLPTATETPASEVEPARFGVVNATTVVNVRSGPGTSFAPVDTLAPGDRVLIIGANEDESWYNILLEDDTPGWVAAFLLDIELALGEEAEEAAARATQAAQTITPEVNARVEPRTLARRGALGAPVKQEPTEPVTPEATEAVTAEATLDVTVEVTPVIGVDSMVDEDLDEISAMPEVLVSTEDTYGDERWFSMTAGILVSAAVITLGTLINIIRHLSRRDRA